MARELIKQELKDGSIKLGYAWTIKEPIANVIIVTGMAEHAIRYDEFANFLNDNGYNVYCIDHYGQGLTAGSEEKCGIVPNSFFSKSVKDIDDLVTRLRASLLPTYIFAHSMGSFMLQDYIQRYTAHVNKVVICGTNGPNAKLLFRFGYLVTKLLVHKKNRLDKGDFFDKLSFGGYNKRIKPQRTKFDWLSVNEENVDKYIADPYCGFIPTKGFFREFLKGNDRLYKRKFLKKIRKDMSVLLIAGEEDPVGAYGKGPKKLQKLYNKLGLEDVQLKLYPGLRHEILNEKEHEAIYKDILKFLKAKHEVAEEILED